MTRPRAQQSNLVLLQREIQQRAMSAYDAADHLGITVKNARPYMRLLTGVRVAYWRNSGQGPWVPVYAIGDEPDTLHPTKCYLNRRKVRRLMENPLLQLARSL